MLRAGFEPTTSRSVLFTIHDNRNLALRYAVHATNLVALIKCLWYNSTESNNNSNLGLAVSFT